MTTKPETYLGAVCKRGHLPPLRFKTNRACVVCEREAQARRIRNEDLEEHRKRSAKWKALNPDKVKAGRRQHRETHKEELREAARDYKARDPNGTLAKKREAREFEARVRELDRELSQPEREAAAREKAHQYYRDVLARETDEERGARREKDRVRYHESFAQDPDRHRFYWVVKRGRQKALKRDANAVCTLTSKQALDLMVLQCWRCAYCGDTGPLELDHKTPISKGGDHALANVQWLCHWHNTDKRDMTDSEYRTEYPNDCL